jgi:predicted transposase YbfD/YdcC
LCNSQEDGHRVQGNSKVRQIKDEKNLQSVILVGSNQKEEQKEVQMQPIILEDMATEGIVFDIGALTQYMRQVTDGRKARGQRYSLEFLLVLIILAKLAGENKPKGIAEWIQLRREQLVRAFQRKRSNVPSYNTIRRTLENIEDGVELQSYLNRFLHEAYGGLVTVLVIIDGKTMRGTIPAGQTQGVHLLAAYLPEEGVVLMQVAVETKENEISAAPKLLATLDLKGRVVCGDAMFTQRTISVQILAQGGDYIWFLKDNQPTLKADAEQFFTPPRIAPGWKAPMMPQEQACSTQAGHGRIEKRVLTVIPDEDGYLDWPGVAQVFKLERTVTQETTQKTTQETVYGITSLTKTRTSAQQLLEMTQQHWGIENGLHYRRDVTLEEDATRITDDRRAETMAILNNFIVGLTSKLGFRNLASAQRTFEARLTFALAAVT